MTFDFFYDLGSPYSYLASTQLEGLGERTGARARLVPITLGGLRKTTGHQLPPPTQLKYMAEDTARWAAQYGVPMKMPRVFPASTIKALRACVAAEHAGGQPQAMRALFRAYWVDDQDITDPQALERALDGAGLDGKALVAAAEEQGVKDALRRNTELALSRGVFGVPMFFVGERSFWGNDRIPFLEKELQRLQ